MPDVLLEFLSEEIPARMQAKASADLVRLFEAELARAGLKAAAIEPFVTPRRLALVARGLPLATAPVSTETKGPRADAPEQAIAGFLGKTGLSRDRLVERADAKGNAVLFAVIETPGRATADVLAEAVPAIVRAFAWPKSMRWGAASTSTESPRWVRPLQGIVLLLDEVVVPCAVAGVTSGRETAGHRFLHRGPVTIANPGTYAETLRAAFVIASTEERRALIRDGATAAADAAGLTLVEDEGLVAENAGLTEWPVPLLGRFDPAFLSVPPEVIQLTARVNQKYFVCRNADGALADAFVCTANIAAADGGAAIVEGNRKVLAARLADARFFYETDLRVPLAEQAKKLDRIVFHEKLGTVADKAERVAKLARWLVEEGIVGSKALSPAGRGLGEGPAPSAAPVESALSPGGERERLAALAEQAGRLCKADLVTGMVGEFPELQGVMGGYYAAAQGLDPAVAAAIRDHYKPVGQSDEIPTAPVTVAVALADKLDTLVVFFAGIMAPTGSKDPYALRRAAISVISILLSSGVRMGLFQAIENCYQLFARASTTEVFQILEGGYEQGTALVSFWFREVDGIADGQPEEHFVHHPLSFSRPDWKTFELGRAESMPPLDIPIREKDWGVKTPFVYNFRPYLHLEGELISFFADRLKVQQREAGVRHDLIDAVFALGGEDDLVRLLARVKALQAFVETADGADLLAGYRRAANILRAEAKKTGGAPTRHPGLVPGSTDPQAASSEAGWTPEQVRGDDGGAFAFPYTPEPAERALANALDATLPRAEAAIADERFGDAMSALSSLKSPIDTFFDAVTVNSPDEAVRATRLSLLARLVAAFHMVADFSKIEG